MATYGLGSVGQVSFTGYTNTLAAGSANNAGTTGYVQFNGIQQGDDRIVKMLRNGGGTIASTRLLYTLLGQAPGSNAAQSKKQIRVGTRVSRWINHYRDHKYREQGNKCC